MKRKISALTIILIILTIITFFNAWGYDKINTKYLWDSLIFIFFFLAIISWKFDGLKKKN